MRNITDDEKNHYKERIIGFYPPKEFLWTNVIRGMASFFIRPSKKLFWYNLSMIIVLMTLSGYLIGKIQNQINHHDLIKRGVSEYEKIQSIS